MSSPASISRITVCAMGYGAGRRVLYCHGDSWHPSGFWAVHGANIERAWHWLTDIFPGDCSTESVVGVSSPLFRGTCRQIGAWKAAVLGALIYSAGLLFTALW